MILAVIVCGFPVLANASADTADNEQSFSARPSVTGRLHLEGQQLVGENGQAAVLRGVSTHGLTYYPDFVDRALFSHMFSHLARFTPLCLP